uniref:Odorant receptor, family D, subfamily 111, member 8 n=1 Tax=Sinocyclocheilus anshuiensis TaxID=1608454 RepID=A0A671R2H5_9TELE
MSSVSQSFSENNSIVHPEYFFIIGLSGIPYILFIIVVDRNLHSPKYIGVFYLALADFGETNALIPNIMKIFVFDSQYISLSQSKARHNSTMQSLTLFVLAYDRFIAICLPLRYHAIVNNTVMCLVFVGLWSFNGGVVAFVVSSITRLSFCKSNAVPSYYCDHGPVYMLACNDVSINNFMAKLCTALYVVAPLLFIVLSYLGIFLALSRITTWEGRLKALKTCVSHLLLVGSFFLPIICIYTAAFIVSVTPNARVISTSLAYAVPPMLNPIIYVLNTSEIKDLIKKYLKKRSTRIENVSNTQLFM